MGSEADTTIACVSGTVSWFNPDKAYGFIHGDDGSDYFVHYSAVDGPHGKGTRNLVEGERVILEPGLGEKGPMARRVSILRPPAASAIRVTPESA